jgi:hypothetical protein
MAHHTVGRARHTIGPAPCLSSGCSQNASAITSALQIQVRVVDKHIRGGRLYLKKGTVVDVHPGALCDVSMDEGNTVVQV